MFISPGMAQLPEHKEQNNNHEASKTIKQSPPDIQGMILPMAKDIGEFELLQSHNRVFNQDHLKAGWSLLFIGYTQCPDVCPTVLLSLKHTVSLMQQKNLIPPQVVFISIDPERDQIDSLNQYVHYFNKNFIGVTGDEEELDDLARQLAVYYKKVPGASGDITNDDYMMKHSASLLLLNPDGHLQAVLSAPHNPKVILESIRKTQQYYLENHD
ncbi:MAG: SCO family protein [Gammaproteobacteria bacterium]